MLMGLDDPHLRAKHYHKAKVFQVQLTYFYWEDLTPYKFLRVIIKKERDQARVTYRNKGVSNLIYSESIRCFSVLRFNFSMSSCKTIFKLVPPSIIMVHNLPWQEACVWKMLVCRQSSSPFKVNKGRTIRLCSSIIPS